MRYGLYCIYNTDTKEFSAPIVFKTEKMAINSFVRHIEMSHQKDKRFFTPSDYGLFFVGMFSDVSGKVEPAKDFKCVKNGEEVDLSDEVKEDDREEVDDGTWTVDDDEEVEE